MSESQARYQNKIQKKYFFGDSILQCNFLVDYHSRYRRKEISIPKVETLENNKFLRIETSANFQNGFDIFDDSLKKNINKI